MGFEEHCQYEQAVIQAAADGHRHTFSTSRPDGDAAAAVSGAFLRDVLRGLRGTLHPTGLALRGLLVRGGLDLSYLSWRGRLELLDCRIEGDVQLSHARVEGTVRLDGTCCRRLIADAAKVAGSLFLERRFEALEGVQGVGLDVSQTLSLDNASISAPTGEEHSTVNALELFRAKLGDALLTDVQLRGGAFLASASVANDFRCSGATATSRAAEGWPDGTSRRAVLVLSGCEIKGGLLLGERVVVTGPLVLSGASCRDFALSPELAESLKDIDLDGFTYSHLGAIPTPAVLLSLSDASTPFSQQPYVQLASYCEKTGQLDAKRKTLVRLEQRLTEQAPQRSWARAWRRVHERLVGYGYRPGLALAWLLACVVISALLVHHLGDAFLIRKPGAAAGPAQPTGTSAVEFALDTILPFAALGSKEQWVVHAADAAAWAWVTAFLVLKFLSWGLAALALGAVTGLARKL